MPEFLFTLAEEAFAMMHRLRCMFLLGLTFCACSSARDKGSDRAGASTTLAAATQTEPIRVIKLGQTMPYSGAASAYSTVGKLHAAYFKQLNENGGIRGRTIQLVSVDDGYSPPKTVEQTRQLVEQERVVAVFQSVGTAANSAVHKYLNAKHLPQLFVSSGATKWADPKNYPYTIGFNPTYQREGRTYAKHILEHTPQAKIGVLYQNDDYGKDLLKG
jgi:ABC-type branched-subunit amino acid transport system substrate-binding protein